MSNYSMIAGYNAALMVTTVAEELAAITPDLHKSTLKTICISGGAMCINITQEYIDYLLNSEQVTDEAKVTIATYKPVPTVIMYEDFFTNVTKGEAQAILMHEVGHIVHEHHLQAATEGVFNLVTENEMMADAFAAEKTSKQDMVNGLKKLLLNTGTKIAEIAKEKGKEYSAEEYYQEAMSQPHIQARFAALQ